MVGAASYTHKHMRTSSIRSHDITIKVETFSVVVLLQPHQYGVAQTHRTISLRFLPTSRYEAHDATLASEKYVEKHLPNMMTALGLDIALHLARDYRIRKASSHAFQPHVHVQSSLMPISPVTLRDHCPLSFFCLSPQHHLLLPLHSK